MMLTSACLVVFLLLGFSLNDVPPCPDIYVIEVPQDMVFENSGSFNVRIRSNNLNDYQRLHIDFPSELTLSDSHGRNDISVDLENNTLTYAKNETAEKHISYYMDELPVGEWSGNMNMRIYLEDSTPSNVLIDGNSLNAVLNGIDPVSISFLSSYTYSEDDIDVSLGHDRSLLLHNDSRSVTIYPRDGNGIIANRDMSKALGNLTKLETINGINLLDMDDCENLSALFKGDVKLTAINGINSFDTGNVRDMSRMFEMCASLTRLNLNDLDTSSCTDMSYMFSHCLNMTTPGSLRYWDLSQCENTSHMFYNCPKLRNLGTMATWNTENVTDMSSMFENCPVLITTGDISGWDVSSVGSFRSMFRLSSSMRNIGDIGLWDVTSNCSDLSEMFASTEDILPADLDLRNWDISNVNDTSRMFYNCFSMNSLNITGWNSSNLNIIASMFESNHPSRQSQLSVIYGLEELDASELYDMNRAFYGNEYLNADLSSWADDLSNLSDISYAFYGAKNFDLSSLKDWNMPSLVNKYEAFGGGAGSDTPCEIPAWYYD